MFICDRTWDQVHYAEGIMVPPHFRHDLLYNTLNRERHRDNGCLQWLKAGCAEGREGQCVPAQRGVEGGGNDWGEANNGKTPG